MNDYKEEFERVKSIVSLRDYVIHVLGPPAKNGRWLCPLHEEKTPSFSVRGKAYKCYGCDKKGDVVSFVSRYNGDIPMGEAMAILKEWANITDDQKPEPQPEPDETSNEKTSDELPTGWRHFIFHDEHGVEVGAECRKDVMGGKKRTFLYHRNADGQWVNRQLEAPRPLYHLPDMVLSGATTPLYLVEGAKCAEAVIDAGQRATTWMGGTHALNKTDFTPLIRAAKKSPIVLISDGDAPGRKAMRTIRKQLVAAECEVEYYAMSGRRGVDIADILKSQDGNWETAFALLQSRCPNPTKDPLITCDDIIDDIRKNKEFVVLGYQEKSIVVIRKSTGKAVHLPSKGLTDGHLTEICPEGYFWTRLFENPMATLANHPRREIHRALTLVAEERGLWQPKNQIGRGLVHVPGKGYFYHMGDRVVAAGGGDPIGIGQMSSSRAVFAPRPPLRERPNPCRPSEFKTLNDALNDFSWRDPYGGTLLLAWMCAALIGGGTYRPHLRLVSGPDMGKNWLMDVVILPIFGDMYNDGGGDASVAGISAKAKGDALPFIINEANPNSRQMRDKMSNLQNLLLGAYDPAGTPILRATQDGEMREAYVRSSFLLAGNQVAQGSEANESRMFHLSMTGKLDPEPWRDLETRIERAIDSYAPGIRALMMSRAEVILGDLKLVTKQVQDDEKLNLSGRESRNVALLTACHANLYPHADDRKIQQITLSAHQIVTAMGQRIKITESIVDAIVSIRDQDSRMSLKDTWVQGHLDNADESTSLKTAKSILRTMGVFIEKKNVKGRGEMPCLFINAASSELRNYLARDITWATVNIAVALEMVDGCFTDRRRFGGGDGVTAHVVPLEWKVEQDEMPIDRNYQSPNIKPLKIVENER